MHVEQSCFCFCSCQGVECHLVLGQGREPSWEQSAPPTVLLGSCPGQDNNKTMAKTIFPKLGSCDLSADCSHKERCLHAFIVLWKHDGEPDLGQITPPIHPPIHGFIIWGTLKTLTSLNIIRGPRRVSQAILAFGVFPLFLPLAIAAFGGPEGYFRLAIIAFGASQLVLTFSYVAKGTSGLQM